MNNLLLVVLLGWNMNKISSLTHVANELNLISTKLSLTLLKITMESLWLIWCQNNLVILENLINYRFMLISNVCAILKFNIKIYY